MLVARYFNHKCTASQPKAKWEHYVSRDLRLPKGQELTQMAPSKGMRALTLKRPISFSKRSKERRTRISMDYFGGCHRVVGTVLARDRGNHLALGIVARPAKGSCKKELAEVSLQQPFLSKKIAPTDLFPMKLRGMMSH